jgi:hypothetical protein
MSICTVATFLPCAFLVPPIHQSQRPSDPPPFGAGATTAVLLFHASMFLPLSLVLTIVRGAVRNKVKHLTKMLVEVLRGDASSLACFAGLQTQL